jgi:hypothetical protein
MVKQFKIPLQSEVAKYMREKMGWPSSFCTYYAERFWGHYQSNGWKVSGRAAMKDWKAAFNSNWQNIKFPEDQAKLSSCMVEDKKLPAATNGQKLDPYQRLDQLMMLYNKDPKAIEEERYCKMHDWLKEQDLISIPSDQEQIITDLVKQYEGPQAQCRAKVMRVQFLFLNMIGKNESFSKFRR